MRVKEFNDRTSSFQFLKESKQIYRDSKRKPFSCVMRNLYCLLDALEFLCNMNTCVLGQQWLKTEILGTVFNDLLASFDLKQWVTTPTHASGHTLDLIITRNQCGVLGDSRVVDPLISDHCTIFMSLLVHKPHL